VNKELHFYELKIWNSEECFEEEHGRTAQHITQLKILPVQCQISGLADIDEISLKSSIDSKHAVPYEPAH